MTKLNLGAGFMQRPGYTNIDFYPHPSVDIVHDLREGIPFPDNSVDEVMSHHFLDYLDYPQAAKLLAECYRVLKPGGIVRHCVNDLRSCGLALHNYGLKALWMKEVFWGAMEGPNDTSIYKKCGFDQELLKEMLQGVGFRDVTIKNNGPRKIDNIPDAQYDNFDFWAVGTK